MSEYVNHDNRWDYDVNAIGNRREPPYQETLLCPRCNMRLLPYGHPGALSRVDNATEICSECGQDEALQQWAGFQLGPTSTWPLRRLI